MTPEELQALRDFQEDEFRKITGQEWPNCAVADCEYKAHVPSQFCYAHMQGKQPKPVEHYFNVKAEGDT